MLLKLTTDRHEASRGLFAAAELLVSFLTGRTQQVKYASYLLNIKTINRGSGLGPIL